MTKRTKKQISILFKAFSVMFIGLFLFKWVPMQIWGENILFDASAHITIAIFILYVIWFFIDQNKKMHTPFFVFSFLVLAIISLQRVLIDAHNDIGLLAGLIISVSAILYSQFDFLKEKINF
jgi:hypothetical protein